jgi:hypothetical protein
MHKAIVAGAFVLVALAGGLVSVATLDPARFAPLVEAELSRITGQTVAVNGPVALSLFPDPAIAATDIASADDALIAVRIARVRIQLSWRALLRGDTVARGVQVFGPRVELPADAVGAFTALVVPPPPGGTESRRPATRGTATRLEVDDGRVRIVGPEDVVDIGSIAARLTQSETGERRITSAFVLAGLRNELDAHVQPVGAAGAARFDLTFAIPEADVTGTASGQVRVGPATDSDPADLRVSITADAKRLADVLAVLGVRAPGEPTAAWTNPASLRAEIVRAGDTVTADPLTLDANGQSARARVRVSLADRSFVAEATMVGLVADHWLALPSAIPSSNQSSRPLWRGSLSLSAPLFTVGGQVGRDGVLAATLAERQWTVSRLAATLPGQADFEASGFVRGDAGETAIDGAWSLSARDPRGFFAWLGLDADAVRTGRLAVFDARGTVLGNARALEIGDLAVRLDNANGRGRAGLLFGERVRYRLDLSVDEFVLDPYRAAVGALFAPAAAPDAPETAIYGVTPPPAPLSTLAAFDADVRLDIQKLIAGDGGAGSGAADIDLTAGRLSVRSLSLKDVGGLSLFASGAIGNLGTAPTAETFEVSASATDRATFSRAWGLASSARWAGVFPISARATLNGPQVGATLALNGTLGSAEIRIGGTVAWTDHRPRANVEIVLSDAMPRELLRALAGIDVPDAGAPFAARGKVELSPGLAAWSDARVELGKSTFTTTGKIETRPGAETFTVNFDDVSFDWPGIRGTPANVAAPRSWSEAAFAPFWPPTARGSIRIAGPALTWRGLMLTDFSAVLSFDDNTLELSQWRGNIFGGPAQVQLRIDNAPKPAARLQMLIGDAKPGELFAWLGTAGGGDGTIDLAVGLATDGPSPRAWISRLSGSGSFKIETLQRRRPADQGGPLGFLTAPAAAAGASAARVATGAAFRIVDGKLSLQDGTLTTNAYAGPMRGEVDFADWRMNVSANLRAQAAAGTALRVSAEGAPDAPTVKVTAEK